MSRPKKKPMAASATQPRTNGDAGWTRNHPSSGVAIPGPAPSAAAAVDAAATEPAGTEPFETELADVGPAGCALAAVGTADAALSSPNP